MQDILSSANITNEARRDDLKSNAANYSRSKSSDRVFHTRLSNMTILMAECLYFIPLIVAATIQDT